MNNTLVIIPTYNERCNIESLFAKVFKAKEDLDILVVDDNSSDKTYELVQELADKDPRINLIVRPRKMGLGSAYIRGFKFALKKGYEYILEMDADLSHDPEDIPRLLEACKDADLVIGSRYIKGVHIVNWPLKRLFLSYGASFYVRFLTGMHVKDPTGGFKCFRAKVLQAIDLDKVHAEGYSFQIEMNYKAWRKGFEIKEIPIVFTDRTLGQSKMSKGIIFEAIFMVWRLRFSRKK